MYPGLWAAKNPDKPAVIMADTGEALSYAQLEDRSLRLANHLRSLGLEPGDHFAMMAENRFEIVEAYWAAMRTGTLITLINWHLSLPEAQYIAQNCDARVLIVSAGVSDAAAFAQWALECEPIIEVLSVGAEIPGCDPYEDALARASAAKPDYEPRGDDMLYSSGTTGRPKGILPTLLHQPVEDENVALVRLFTEVFGFDESTVYLSPAPLYHAAPIRFIMTTHSTGGTAVVMPSFHAAQTLETMQRYGVTHAQFVPTMFVRLLKLPVEIREEFDPSALRAVIHAAAPCPAQVKRQMIEWWGPVIYEYYSSTESNGLTLITSDEALAKPGSVGRDGFLGTAHICGPGGEELPAGEVGTIYFEHEEGRDPFVYYKDEEKTAGTRHPDHPRWTTTGDLGHLDDDRYLFMAERSSFLIITGGVNIYPQEIENHLSLHPDIYDIAVVGQPDEDLGQIAAAYVELDPATRQPDESIAEVEARIRSWCEDGLAKYKIPRSFTFVDALPRTPTGKLVKRRLTEQTTDRSQETV